MVKRKLAALEKVEADLTNLQHKIRRDPPSYQIEFGNQYHQYEVYRDILLEAPSTTEESRVISLHDLIGFVSHVADCYRAITKNFAQDLIGLLSAHHAVLEYELRDKIVGSLVLLRKKGIIDSSTLLNTFFSIRASTPSKSLRALLFQRILSELRNSNSKTINHRLNRTTQNALFELVTSDRTTPKTLWAVKLTRELWKRQIWTDPKSVEIMKEAALAENKKVIIAGVRFFLGGDKEREEAAEEESDEEDGIDMAQLRHQAGINKKTNKKEKELKKAAATVRKRERKKNQPHPLNFSAFHLLHDPQGFAEVLFAKHLQAAETKLNLEQKLLILQLVSRLVGLHKLALDTLYSYFLKYLSPRQPSVTSFLASLAQATHNLVPPDMLEPLIQKIVNEFVSEAAASEVASAGLNAIREICARQPLAMNETLLQDLVMYRKSKDKGVMMAAKGLLSLYREVEPEMLHKRDRGRDAALSLRAGDKKRARFGEEKAGEIEGLELLEKWKEDERKKRREEKGLPLDNLSDEEADQDAEDEAGWANWDAEEDGSDDSGGWIGVHSGGSEIDISDDEDSPGPSKRVKIEKDTTAEKEPIVANEDVTNIPKLSKLATTRILTPVDLAKLQELRAQAEVSKLMPNKKRQKQLEDRHADDPFTAEQIEGLATLSAKRTKEEKIAMARADREERHQSTTAKRKEKKEAEGKSTTNKEKARKKNFMMTLGKAKAKSKRSLIEHRKILKAHSERKKRGGRRSNR
ncbi:SDA1 domain protein [Viridothelium virens]|uniref:Protein SDA1 n=1 Tax=Viridothelium virens TaxID=1048519 RepID=A0A6A6GW95_VIRVR|nr:SDA1 domain protein [Viridothelium virens]